MTDILTRDQARTRLARLGYSREDVATALRGALQTGGYDLAGHTIGTVTGADIHFTITSRESYPAHPAAGPEPSITQDELTQALLQAWTKGDGVTSEDIFKHVLKQRDAAAEDSKWETGALYADFIPAAPAVRPEWMIFERTQGGWYNRSNVFTADGGLNTSGLRKLVFEETRPASMLQPASFGVDAGETLDGHELAAQQIAKHGTDRYPTVAEQYAKLLDEMGELAEALISGGGAMSDAVRTEYADAGLSLYELGNKLGLDLITCMRKLVASDTRTFTAPATEGGH